MNFGHPKMLWLMLGLIPLLGWFLWWTWARRRAVIRQFVQNRFLEEFAIGGVAGFQKLRRVLLCFSVALLLFALARPQWGFTWEEASQRGRDIIVAIDTSKSMLAEDIQPNRLERAKLAALDLLQIAKYDRLGLVAFAGTAFLQCPLTLDDEAYRQSVQILQPGVIPQGGTALSEAIQAARAAFNEDEAENHKILILFTDGEDHEENVMELVQKVAQEGMRIFTVGVGTPAGELLRIRDENGNLGYLKDENGNVVKSRLNEQLLQQIATAASGFYLPLRGGNAMEILYQRGLAPLPTSEHSSKLMKRFKEQYYWPLSIAIILLVLEIFLPERKAAKLVEGDLRSRAPVAVTAAILLLLLPSTLSASPAKALKNYKSGEYKSAYYEYKRLLEKEPADARLHFNAGASAYQARKFDEAIKSFQAAVASKDPILQEQSYYNLGNSEFRLGESDSNPQQKMAQWEQAVQHYDAALKVNPNDKDAKFNKEVVQKKLEELKKEQQQQQNQQNKDKNKNNKDQNQDQKDQQKNNEQQNKEDKDQQKQQKQKQDNSSEKQKQNQQDQQQQEQDQEKQKQQQAANQQQKDKEKSEQGQPKPGEQKDSDQGQDPEEAQAAQYAQLGKMTPAQAKQLLDAQKGEEKAMIFIPPQKKSSQQNRAFKDW